MKALRSSQLDAGLLDAEVETLLLPHWTRVWAAAPGGGELAQRYPLELRTLLAAILLVAHRVSLGPSYGERLCGLRWAADPRPSPFCSPTQPQQSAGGGVSDRRSLSTLRHAVCGVVGLAVEYLLRRLSQASPDPEADPVALPQRLLRWALWAEPYGRLISLLHLLTFLVHGRHRSLWDRLCGVRLVAEPPSAPRMLNFEPLEQQMAAERVAALLSLAAPILQPWGTRILRRLQPATGPAPGAPGTHRCGFCDSDPSLPHTAPCGHSFCYFCVQSRRMLDSTLACPVCRTPLTTSTRATGPPDHPQVAP